MKYESVNDYLGKDVVSSGEVYLEMEKIADRISLENPSEEDEELLYMFCHQVISNVLNFWNCESIGVFEPVLINEGKEWVILVSTIPNEGVVWVSTDFCNEYNDDDLNIGDLLTIARSLYYQR